jgi:hypothetical protein
VTPVLDPEGVHLAALRRLGDFRARRVLEMGCGDGRLTAGIAEDVDHVLAFDPDAERVAEAERTLPTELVDRVSFQVASRRSGSSRTRSTSSCSRGRSDASNRRTSWTSWTRWCGRCDVTASSSTCR